MIGHGYLHLLLGQYFVQLVKCGISYENLVLMHVYVFGLQVMKEWGAHVTTSCSTDAVELVKRLGADDVIDYKTEDIAKRIRREPRYWYSFKLNSI